MTDSEAPSRNADAAPASGRRWLWLLAAWVCILAPVLLLALLLREHLVNIPFLDDYMFVPMLKKAAAGFRFTLEGSDEYLTLHDFFMVQMEHRLAFVRALILLRHHFWPTDITVENWFTFAFLCGTSLNVGLLLRRTAGEFRGWWPVLAFATLAIFTPVQYQVILWAMMFQVACPAFFLSTALVALVSNLPLWARWTIGALSGVFAMQCIASGLLVWMLPLFVMVAGGALPKTRAKWIYIGTWLAAFAVVAFFYFHGMKNETEGRFSYKQNEQETMHRNLSAFVGSPEKAMPFVLRLVGGNLARGTGANAMTSSLVMGGISVALLIAAGLYFLLRIKDEQMRDKLAPWIAFGSYSLATALLVSIGRLWATSSGDNSISPRYVIHAVPLTVSLGAMAWIIARDLRLRKPAWIPQINRVMTGAAVALLALQAVSWLQGERLMDTWSSARRRMAVNTMFFAEPHSFNKVEMDGLIAPNFEHARELDRLGALKPKMLGDNRLANFKLIEEPLSKTTARWKSLLVDPEKRTLRAMGFAWLAGRRSIADGIFLCYRDAKDKEWKICHISQVRAMPGYLVQTVGRDLQNVQLPGDSISGEATAGFDSEVSFDQLPPADGAHELSAWAFDYRTQTAQRMAGDFKFDPATGKVQSLTASRDERSKDADADAR